jgi:signal transduction histidine kinase
MSLRLSEPPLSRRSRTFLRRWQQGPFRDFLQSRAQQSAGPVALVDPDGTLLANLGGTAANTDLRALGELHIGEPPIASLVGDIRSLDADMVSLVELVVLTLDDFDHEMQELSEHALERYRELSLLYDFSEKASSATASSEVMDVILRKAVNVVHASGASVVVIEPDNHLPELLASVGTVPSVGDDAVRRVVETGRPLVGLFAESLREVDGDAWIGTLACIPLRTSDRVIGVLVVVAQPGRELRLTDRRLLTALASLAAMRIAHAWLTEANARKRELAAVGHVASAIVHDFKNPLTAVRGFAEMIQMDHIPAEEHASLAEQIIENADRLSAMVEEILHFVRGNRTGLDLQPISGACLTDRLRACLRHGTQETVQLNIDLTSIDRVVLDVRKFERVIINLVRNASEAIVHSGAINVHGEVDPHDPGSVRILVEDDGPGIPRHLHDALFDPFTTSGKRGGTGLGLAIVKKIVEDHGGSIRLEAEVGKGSRFVIGMPRERTSTECCP